MLIELRHKYDWWWFKRNKIRLRRVAAWAVHHHAGGGIHDDRSIMNGEADRRVCEAATTPLDKEQAP